MCLLFDQMLCALAWFQILFKTHFFLCGFKIELGLSFPKLIVQGWDRAMPTNSGRLV